MRSAEMGVHMTRTWLSLFYETGYLLVAGVFCWQRRTPHLNCCLAIPRTETCCPGSLEQCCSQSGLSFADCPNAYRELYTTTIVVRVPLMAVNLWLFYYSGNPLFLTLFVIVTLGVVLTVTGYVLDRRSKVNDSRT